MLNLNKLNIKSRYVSCSRKYIPWQKYSPSQIESIYIEPLDIALSDFESDHHSDHSFDDLHNIIWPVCESNMKICKSDLKSRLQKKKTVPRLPWGFKNIKGELNTAFNQWKSESQPTDGDSYFYYRNEKTGYRQAMRNFIAGKENEKIVTLCDTLSVNEK